MHGPKRRAELEKERQVLIDERRRLEHVTSAYPSVLGLRKPNAKQLELKCASSLAPASKLYIGNPYQACLLEWWF
jgi:hypothetical protein